MTAAVQDLSLERLVRLDERIDAHEGEALRDRWEFGQEMLAARDGAGRLPNGYMTALANRTGKSRAELGFRVRFAERFPTETELHNALHSCRSWREIVTSFSSKPRQLSLVGEAEEPDEDATPFDEAPDIATVPAGRFGTILADPPWSYEATSQDARLRGYTDQHYKPLTTQDLCDLPVGDLAHDRSVLLLWTTFPFIGDALKVIDAWGFTYVSGLAWVKAEGERRTVGYGVGYWFRGAVELLLVGKRKASYRSQYVGLIHEGLNHSRKPDSVYDIAESTYPGPRLELFARKSRDGWTGVGNEADGDGGDIRDSLPALAARLRGESGESDD